MPTWVVGSAPDCDVVVDQPTVSGRHCRVTRAGGGYSVEDLGSTNGTFVNGAALTAPRAVTRSDVVTLGLTAPLPWDRLVEAVAGSDRVIRIGRDPDNDVVLDYPAVSGHHAQVIVAGGRATIEDLGSTNGTSIGEPGRFITRVELTESDTVFLGSFEIPASRLLRASPARRPAEAPASIVFRGVDLILGRDEDCDVVVELPVVSGRHARLYRSGDSVLIEDLGSSNGTFVDGREIRGAEAIPAGATIGLGDWPMKVTFDAPGLFGAAPAGGSIGRMAIVGGLLAQAPLLAGLIAAFSTGTIRRPIEAEGWDRAVAGFEGVAFALGLAALWIGATTAVGALSATFPTRRGPAGLVARLAVLGVAAGAQCVILMAIVHGALQLRGSGATMIAVLALSSWVGLGIGSIARALSPSMGVAFGVVAALFLPLIGLAGGPGLPGSSSPTFRVVSRATPARWAYEGVLLAESDARPTLAVAGDEPRDLADGAFPFDEARMGVRACYLALTVMALGLAGWTAVVIRP